MWCKIAFLLSSTSCMFMYVTTYNRFIVLWELHFEFPVCCRFPKDALLDGDLDDLQAAEGLQDLLLSWWSDNIMRLVCWTWRHWEVQLILVVVLAHRPLYGHFGCVTHLETYILLPLWNYFILVVWHMYLETFMYSFCGTICLYTFLCLWNEV